MLTRKMSDLEAAINQCKDNPCYGKGLRKQSNSLMARGQELGDALKVFYVEKTAEALDMLIKLREETDVVFSRAEVRLLSLTLSWLGYAFLCSSTTPQ